MFDIAPLNYERWAVMVSPLLVDSAPDVKSIAAARHAEEFTQLSASPRTLGSPIGEGLTEPDIRPEELRRKTLKRESEPASITSHPAEWLLVQPFPSGIFNSAPNQPALDPGKVTELYKHPEPTRGPAVRISG